MKRLLFFLLISGSAQAIQDTNGNGMSDVWERHFNSNVLLSASNPAHAPTADPDGDGWNNAKEAVAGTNPFSTVLPAGIVQMGLAEHPDVAGLFVVSWNSLAGKSYQIQVSQNLTSWNDLGEKIPGTGSSIQLAVEALDEDGNTAQVLFWRAVIVDTDEDSDSLTRAEELALGSDPTLPDTDFDGLLDGVDATPADSDTLASPDGANTPTGAATNLRGFWDFETVQGTPSVFPDKSGANRHAQAVSGGPQLLGMPSKCAQIGPSYITVPASAVQGQNTYTVSGWFRFGKDSIKDLSNSIYRAVYMLYDLQGTGPAPQNAPLAQGSGLLVRKSGTNEQWFVGGYRQSAYYNEPPNSNGNPKTTQIGYYFTRPLGTTDDGEWHHFVVTRSATSNGQKVYIDGVLMVEGAVQDYPVSFDADTRITLGRLHPDHTPTALPDAYVDRLRINARLLSAADVLALYHQDIDRDGLWDLTEVKTRLWRDTSVATGTSPEEYEYLVSPYRSDVGESDHDRDGLDSLTEQTLGTLIADADSDDDGLLDGYDKLYGLGPLIPDTNLATDTDGDGLTLEQEAAYGTNPTKKDSDGDGVFDNVEINQGSRPNDASDGGQAPNPADRLALTLAIGDQSGSESEDYHLVAYRYDPGSHTEQEIYRLRSGGFGKYSGDKTVNIFRKDEDYTFRIHWQGTNNNRKPASSGNPAEGPDYDYTMKVEAPAGQDGFVISDAIKPATGEASGTTLLGEKSDVTNFQQVSKENAVAATSVRIDLAVDTDMDGYIESLPDGAMPNGDRPWPGAKIDDRQLDDANPPRAVVIDVNNNNTDARTSTSSTKDQVDNENTLLDTDSDKVELTAGSGHTFSRLRVYAYPVAKFKSGELSLKLSFPEAAHANVVRVFDWRSYSPGNSTPTELLGPGKASVTLDSAEFFGTGFNTAVKDSYRDLLMEGLTYGTAKLRLEIVKNGGAPQVLASDEVLVTVNVDRLAQAPGQVAGNQDARQLRGFAPHHVGIRKTGLGDVDTSHGLRAVRGSFTARLAAAGETTRLTPMSGRRLKENVRKSTNEDMGASFWVGLTLNNAQGGLEQWVQGGMRWLQPKGTAFGSVPALYLETGDTYLGLGAKSLTQAISGDKPELLGGGVVITDATPLKTWNTAPIKYSFILFKRPVDTDEHGRDVSTVPWQLIIRDDRGGTVGNDSFVHLDLSNPTNQSTVGAAIKEELQNRYRGQKFRDLDALFETSLSVCFAPGSPSQHAVINGLQVASGYVSPAPSSPPNPNASNGKQDLYNWAVAAFQWSVVPIGSGDLKQEFKTGKSLPDGRPQNGTTPHPNWQMSIPAGGGFEIWDNRPYGFGN